MIVFTIKENLRDSEFDELYSHLLYMKNRDMILLPSNMDMYVIDEEHGNMMKVNK